MSYDDTNDYVIDALRLLLKANCNAELSPIIDHATSPAVDTTRGYPQLLAFVANARLPMMAVYRLSEQVIDYGKQRYNNTQFVIEYYAPETPLDRLDERWPLLKNVYDCVKKTLLICPTIAAIPDIAILTDAGFVQIDRDSVGAEYSFAVVGGSNAYPFVKIKFTAWVEEFGLRDVSGLLDFLGLNIDYFVTDSNGDTSVTPQLQSILNT